MTYVDPDEIRCSVRAALNAWLTRVDDADYSILLGDHEERVVDEIVRRLGGDQ